MRYVCGGVGNDVMQEDIPLYVETMWNQIKQYNAMVVEHFQGDPAVTRCLATVPLAIIA